MGKPPGYCRRAVVGRHTSLLVGHGRRERTVCVNTTGASHVPHLQVCGEVGTLVMPITVSPMVTRTVGESRLVSQPKLPMRVT